MKGNILLVEDDADIAGALREVLEGEGLAVTHASDGGRGMALAETRQFDLAITDMKMPGLSGLDLVKRLHAAKPRLPVILITAYGTTESAIEATKHGAYDYLLKPFEMPELIALVRKALAASRLLSGTVAIGVATQAESAIIGNSRPMQAIYKEIGRIAARPVTVLIRGETGTGKELIARAIYQHSDRSGRPFIAVNCAAIPETLLESELFGHERGAFTGADARRIGRFEQAHGGTILLDEVGDMTVDTQAKLLRVLQENCIQRLGGKEIIPVDVRVIAATHCDLERAMEERRFREDLFYRLNVVTLSLPPLRERAEDIPDLARYFSSKYAAEFGVEVPSIHPEAMELLRRQPWPGNVRELENVVRKALLLGRGYGLSADAVRDALIGARKPGRPMAEGRLDAIVTGLLDSARAGEIEMALPPLIETVERELYSQAIRLAAGNQAKAARWVGVSRITMRQKLQQFGLHPSQQQEPPD